MAAQAPNTIVYDADCPYCRRQIERIRRWDTAGRFEYVPRQAPDLFERFPGLRDVESQDGLRFVGSAGQIAIGPDAVFEIARRLPGWRGTAAWLYRVPGFHGLFKKLYWRTARKRVRGCDDQCEVPARETRERVHS